MSFFIPAQIPVLTDSWITENGGDSCFALFCGQDVLLLPDEYSLPDRSDLNHLSFTLPVRSALYIGQLNGRKCYAFTLNEKEKTASDFWIPFRIATGLMTSGIFTAVCRAKELLHWRNQHKFCGHCGNPLSESKTDAALICPVCGEHYYPQIAPAVIVAVIRNGKEILLAHNRRFRENIYGLIAGFVEAGESAEQAIAREIMEETGITVGNIRYFSSQCWPFPNSLMLGYYADYVSGDAEADGDELSDLGWFSVENLPQIPPPGSIARRLIDDFVRKQGGQTGK